MFPLLLALLAGCQNYCLDGKKVRHEVQDTDADSGDTAADTAYEYSFESDGDGKCG